VAPRVVLFDLDGTLWDSFPWYAEILGNLTGAGRAAILSSLQDGASVVTAADKLAISRSTLLRSCLADADRLRIFPGVKQTLPTLAARSKLGIVTSLPGSLAEPLLRRCDLASKFSVVIHAGNCRSRKPSPGGLLSALRSLGEDPGDDVLYVGDRGTDCQAAIRAGIRFMWASYGYGPTCPDGTAFVLDSFNRLVDA
jgi:HAD superfamily hydrolase (TIGR01509 family)